MTFNKAAARAAGPIECALNTPPEATIVKSKIQSRGVALALWDLRPWCPDEWLLAFWEAGGPDHDIRRSKGLHAAYNGIVWQLRGSGER